MGCKCKYATPVNRQKINEVMDALQMANQDINILLNITDVLIQGLRYYQIYTYAYTIFAYLRECLTYIKKWEHTMDYVHATTTKILSPDILQVEELRGMLRHIEPELPIIMYLTISSANTLNFTNISKPMG